MGEKKEEDLYRNFSRKDLQGLCKKYGLPARKSNSEMATSLILYLEKKNIKSKYAWEACRSDPYLSLWSELQPGGKMSSVGNKRTDSREISSHNGFCQFQKRQDPDQNDLQTLKSPCSDKASEDMGHLTQLQRGSNSGAGDVENAFSSVLSSTAEASLSDFNYYVRCDDGIELFVDLNSTTSDWIENLKAGVHACHDIHDFKSSGSDEREGPSLLDSHNNAQLEDESCPTIAGTGISLQPDQLGEEQATLSSISKSAIELQNCGSECLMREENELGTYSNASSIRDENDPKCSKTGDVMYKEPCSQNSGIPPGPVCKINRLSGAPFVGAKASASVNILQLHDIASSSSRPATCPVSTDQQRKIGPVQFGPFAPSQFFKNVPQMWHFQASDQRQYEPSSNFMSSCFDAGHLKAKTQLGRGCDKTRLSFPFQRLSPTNVNLDTSIKKGNGGFIRHTTGQEAVELPRRDAPLSPFSVGGTLDLGVLNKNRSDHRNLSYSNNLIEDACHSQGKINLGYSKVGDGNKSLESNKFQQSMKEPCVNLSNSEYIELGMKRHFNSVDDQSHPGNPKAKVVRTSKQFSGDMRASRQRSMKPSTKWNVHDKSGDARDNL